MMNVDDMVRRVPDSKMDVAYFATIEGATEMAHGIPGCLRQKLDSSPDSLVGK
jgi:hypothetical protein